MWAMAFVVNTALAQQPAVQLAQGQSPEQTQQDMADCQAIARQSTGYDPAQATTQTAAPAQPQAGGRARGAAKGALAGAAKAEAKGQQYEAYDKLSDDVKQEYRQNEAKSAAAAGAAVGASRQRQERRQQGKSARAAGRAGQCRHQRLRSGVQVMHDGAWPQRAVNRGGSSLRTACNIKLGAGQETCPHRAVRAEDRRRANTVREGTTSS
jgi:hypothetical protein